MIEAPAESHQLALSGSHVKKTQTQLAFSKRRRMILYSLSGSEAGCGFSHGWTQLSGSWWSFHASCLPPCSGFSLELHTVPPPAWPPSHLGVTVSPNHCVVSSGPGTEWGAHPEPTTSPRGCSQHRLASGSQANPAPPSEMEVGCPSLEPQIAGAGGIQREIGMVNYKQSKRVLCLLMETLSLLMSQDYFE